ncbi:MAG TPA: hypothetical protein VLA74_06610 [Nitrososphaeraceae archaeon]|nr:hypothetical protein [Nitrososphaeraceae archaeon]
MQKIKYIYSAYAHMDTIGYIYHLYELQKKFSEPGEAPKQLLPLFAINKYITTYQCFKELNKQKKISYKNVHKRVKKLLELGLIKEVTNNIPTKHGSIFYKLSSFGIYYIFLAIRIDKIAIQKLFENYLNDDLFDKVLFQYIEKKTIKAIKSLVILDNIFNFINGNLLNIDYVLKHFLPEVEKEGGYLTTIAPIDNLVHPDQDSYLYGGSKEFIDYLRKKFNIKWLNKETSKINFDKKDNNIIEITDKKDKLIIKLDKEKKRAILYNKQNILFEFELEEILENSFAINEFRSRTLEEYITELDLFKYAIGRISNLCIQVLEYASAEDEFWKSEAIEMAKSLKLLSKDKKFKNTLEQIKNKFDTNFDKFENLSLT